MTEKNRAKAEQKTAYAPGKNDQDQKRKRKADRAQGTRERVGQMKKNNAVKYFHDWHFNELTGSPVFTQVGVEFYDPYHKLEWTFGPMAMVFLFMTIIGGAIFGWIAAAISGGLAIACFLLAVAF